MKVWCVFHCSQAADAEKLVGIYSTPEKAEEIRKQYETPDGFDVAYSDEYEVDAEL